MLLFVGDTLPMRLGDIFARYNGRWHAAHDATGPEHVLLWMVQGRWSLAAALDDGEWRASGAYRARQSWAVFEAAGMV